MSDLLHPVFVPEDVPFAALATPRRPCSKRTRDVSSGGNSSGSALLNVAGDDIPNTLEVSPSKPYLIGTVMELRRLGYTSNTFSLGNTSYSDKAERRIRRLLLQKEYRDAAARIRQATDFDNQIREAAKPGSGSSGSLSTLHPALTTEGCEVGRRVKRLLESDEDKHSPPRKRRCIMLQRSISGPNEADSLNLGDDRSQDEESPASFERVPATFDQESVVTFTTEKEAIDEEAEENQNASEDEAGPSVPRVARGPYRHRKLSARDCYDLAELNLPPLNQVFEVGCKKPMAEKLEYILSTLGRPAMKGEIIDALDTAWPVKKIDKSSSNTISQYLSNSPKFIAYVSPHLKGTFWTLAALPPPDPALFRRAPSNGRGVHKTRRPQGQETAGGKVVAV